MERGIFQNILKDIKQVTKSTIYYLFSNNVRMI